MLHYSVIATPFHNDTKYTLNNIITVFGCIANQNFFILCLFTHLFVSFHLVYSLISWITFQYCPHFVIIADFLLDFYFNIYLYYLYVSLFGFSVPSSFPPFLFAFLKFILIFYTGSRGSAVGWGTALQAGRSRIRFPMVSLAFFIVVILPVALWPWGRLSL